ncbi:MAG: dihydrofolate reductase [Clostridia bacterium]|nr:dihydrofolate reductase [Clostridia bacterium]
MKCIVAVDKNWGIGKKNDLLFYLPYDLKEHFKPHTLNKVVVMGANTFYSLPKGALPKRINVVLDHTGTEHAGATTVTTLDELFEHIKQYNTDDVMIIGGATVYKLMLPYCDTAYITKVDADGEAEVFFPNLDEMADWICVETSEPIVDNVYNISFCTYKK